jgi:hypothetical protein
LRSADGFFFNVLRSFLCEEFVRFIGQVRFLSEGFELVSFGFRHHRLVHRSLLHVGLLAHLVDHLWALPYRELTGEYPKDDWRLNPKDRHPIRQGISRWPISRLCSDAVGWFGGELRPPK